MEDGASATPCWLLPWASHPPQPQQKQLSAPLSCQRWCSIWSQPCQTEFSEFTLPCPTSKSLPMLFPLPELVLYFSSIVQNVDNYIIFRKPSLLQAFLSWFHWFKMNCQATTVSLKPTSYHHYQHHHWLECSLPLGITGMATVGMSTAWFSSFSFKVVRTLLGKKDWPAQKASPFPWWIFQYVEENLGWPSPWDWCINPNTLELFFTMEMELLRSREPCSLAVIDLQNDAWWTENQNHRKQKLYDANVSSSVFP